MKWKKIILDLLFPPRCLICGEVMESGAALCARCVEEMRLDPRECCPTCGKPEGSCVCTGNFFFSRCISAAPYGPKLKDAIHALKYDIESPVADQLACMMAKAYQCAEPDCSVDVITEVPMAQDEQKRRGHNQARTLAVRLSELLDLPHLETPMFRAENTAAQHSLSAGRRIENAERAYGYRGGRQDGKTILLIDDVVTTGATLNRCAALLIAVDAKKVLCLTAATTLRNEKTGLPME